jgi:hypothetical protein
MAKPYVVGMVMPQEHPKEVEDGASDDIKALCGDSSDGSTAVPTTVVLLASFKTVHCDHVTHQFMATEREALPTMLVVLANVAREVTRVATEEEEEEEEVIRLQRIYNF